MVLLKNILREISKCQNKRLEPKFDRDPKLVPWDVQNNKIGLESAREGY